MSLEINIQNFTESLNSNNLFIVDVWTPTCTSCKTYSPIFDLVSTEVGDEIIMGKMNGITNREIASEYGIRSVPTTLFFKNGKLLDKKVGPLTKEQLTESISNYNI